MNRKQARVKESEPEASKGKEIDRKQARVKESELEASKDKEIGQEASKGERKWTGSKQG